MEVGVVIGRFQVEVLHAGHRFIINNALKNHRKVIILVGCSPITGTRYDPLDFPTRARMLRAEFPEVTAIQPIEDCQSDEVWSEQVDRAIRLVVPNVKDAVLYGGRSSFVPHYNGIHKAIEVDGGIGYQSGTEQRKEIGKLERNSPDFRAGVIYSTQNSFPYVKMCVDIALVKEVQETKYEVTELSAGSATVKAFQILLGRKEHETKWRLPGGAVDKGETLENAACRELREETSVYAELKDLEYIMSAPVGDWRYTKAGEIGIMTALFTVKHKWDAPRANDDLCEVKWVPLDNAEKMVMNGHKPLVREIRRRYQND